MATFYFDPDLKGIPRAEFKEARTATDSDSYQSGDIVEAWDVCNLAILFEPYER